MTARTAPGGRWSSGLRALLLLILIWAAVCLPRLGSGGFTDTEGHRVLPAWAWLRTPQDRAIDRAGPPAADDALIPRLFERPYLRKPPGMAWAVYVSARALGPTEFSARLVSALSLLALAVASWRAAARWFGPRHALAAGVAALLMPAFWPIARAAEIEMLMLLGSALACLGLIELSRPASPASSSRRDPPSPAAPATLAAVGLALGILLAALAKGPAALPAVLGAALGPIIAGRGARWLARAPVLAAVAVSAVILGALGVLTASRIEQLGEPVITQSPAEFLWSIDRVGAILALPVLAFAMGLPASLAALFPFGPDARREPVDLPAPVWPDDGVATARALGWGFVIALAASAAAGISNPRYALPALVLLPPLVSYAASGLGAAFLPTRRAIARALWLGRPVVWALLLAIACGAWVFALESRRRATSGEAAGERIAALLPDRALIIAHDLVEARPEALHYAARAAGLRGRRVAIRWLPLEPHAIRALARDDHAIVIIARDDQASNEHQRLTEAGLHMRELGRDRVHDYSLVVLELLPDSVP